MDINQIVISIAAPLLLVLIGLSLAIRRFGSIRWAAGTLSSWAAAGAFALGPEFTPLAFALGAATPLYFADAARCYAGLRARPGATALMISIPVTLALLDWLVGGPWAQAGMLVTDTIFLIIAAYLCWPRGPTEGLMMTRFLPTSLLAFVPVNLWYQVSGLAGWPLELPTIGQTISLVVLCCMFMIAVSARIAGEEAIARERLETRLRAQNDALEASEEKARSAEQLASIGTLAAGILHQINNPIGSILAVTQLELSRMPAFANLEEATANLRTIESEAIRCGRIVRNILLIARGHPGRVEHHDLNRIAESAILSTRIHALHEAAQVKWYAASESLPIDVNEVEIEEALINLITNAIESKPGAQIVVRAHRDADEAICTVQDDGPGVLPEARERLFEPFYSTKTGQGGHGLGLSVAHGILTGHGGGVEWVESESGSGSCFRVRLPLSPVPDAHPVREPPSHELHSSVPEV